MSAVKAKKAIKKTIKKKVLFLYREEEVAINYPLRIAGSKVNMINNIVNNNY
jgi:hypothetical protein